MKIALSTSGENLQSQLDLRFGRCKYFYIYDLDNKHGYIIENQGLKANEGAGIVASQQLVEENIDVIITGNLGPNAFNIIEKADIVAYKANEGNLNEVLDKYNNNILEEIKYSGGAHNGL